MISIVFFFLETGKRYQPYSVLLQSLWNLHVTELFSCHYDVTGHDQIPKKVHPHKNFNRGKKCKTDPLKILNNLLSRILNHSELADRPKPERVIKGLDLFFRFLVE